MDISDIGPLPTTPELPIGSTLVLKLDGRPPSKSYGLSMRNANSPERARFLALRDAAIKTMGGHKWHEGPVELDLVYCSPDPPAVLDNQYLSGVMDTLGGSHGRTFIYLPIVYLDDCQVAACRISAEASRQESYTLSITLCH